MTKKRFLSCRMKKRKKYRIVRKGIRCLNCTARCKIISQWPEKTVKWLIIWRKRVKY